MSLPASCANCGAELRGEFCSECGQSAHQGQPPTVRHFVHDVTHEFLHVDGKIFRSLRALLLEPGRLPREYWNGRVVHWIRPVRLFLIAAALHLLFATGVGPANFQFDAYRRADNGEIRLAAHDAFVRQADPNLKPLSKEDRDVLFQTFERVYLAVRYLSPILFGCFSWIIYKRHQPYLVRHLVAGLHFYAFWYLCAIFTGLLTRWSPYWEFAGFVSVLYLFLMIRRLYGVTRTRAALGTVVLFMFLVFIETLLALFAMSFAVRQAHILLDA